MLLHLPATLGRFRSRRSGRPSHLSIHFPTFPLPRHFIAELIWHHTRYLQILNKIQSFFFFSCLCHCEANGPILYSDYVEYPSDKAARNLTLIAKTLQTLANFTRFQGKENFMEFMNDFLEKEASTMKQYLKEISSPLSKDQCYSKFDDYIDVCKNLSILHTLFTESLTKVAPMNQRMDRLQRILDGISSHLSQPVTSMPPYSRQTSVSTPSPSIVTVNGMRSNATEAEQRPGFQSLQRNVFRFNDPTVSSSVQVSPNNNTLQHAAAEAGGSPSTKASTLPRNAHLMTPPVSVGSGSNAAGVMAANANGNLSAPGRRTAIDLTTSDDYVMFSALNQSASDPSGGAVGANSPTSRSSSANQFGSTFNVKNGMTKYERVLGLPPAKQSSAAITTTTAPNNVNLDEFIESLQYADESPDAHSGGEGDNNTQGSQVSISQLSTVASSGYQSFAYSQSSSPVDPTISSGQEATPNGQRSSSNSSFRQQASNGTSVPANSAATSGSGNGGGGGNNNNSDHSAAIAFTNPIYNLRSKPGIPLPRGYAASYGYESVLNRTPSCEDLHQTVLNTPRVTLISNGVCGSSSSPNNNSLSSGTMSRPRISSSSSDSASCLTTPPHERRLFMSTAPRTNPRCVYPSPVPSQNQVSPVDSNNPCDSQYVAIRRKGRKSSTGTTQTSRGRVYDSSSSDSEYEQLPSTRFRDRNVKRGSRIALDRFSNPKSLDEVHKIHLIAS